MKIFNFLLLAILLTSFADAEPKRIPRRHVKPNFQSDRSKPLAIKGKPVELGTKKGKIDLLRVYNQALGIVQVGQYLDYTTGWKNPSTVAKLVSHTQTLSGAGFSKISDGCTGTILPGETCWFTIRFSPTAGGSFLGTLNVTYRAEYPPEYEPDPTDYADTLFFQAQGYDPEAYDPNPPPLEVTCKECGSVINVDSQTVAEAIPIVGTPFSLWYSSEFAAGFHSPYNTKYRDDSFNPEGFSVSIHHRFDIFQKRILLGSGSASPTLMTFRSGETWVPSAARDEIYVFNSFGYHLETKNYLTGATKYLFAYDSNGKLVKITDAFGNETDFVRTGGVLSSIVAPHGQTTVISTVSGMITEVKNPKNESYTMTYKPGTGLMQTFTKPGGQVTTFTYNSVGQLTKDLGNGGNFWEFAETLGSLDRLVTQTSNLGREKRIYNYQYADFGGSARWTETASDVRSEHVEYPDGDVLEYDDGTGNIRFTAKTYDPRFLTYDRVHYVDEIINSVHKNVWHNRSIAGKTGDFDFTTLTDSWETNGRSTSVSTRVYTKATNTFTTTSAEGATSQQIINNHEQTVGTKIGSDTAYTYTYDTAGRLASVAQGSKNGVVNTYNSAGFLSTVTNARSEQTSYTYDLAGRVTQVTLPDLRVVGYSYDSNGSLVGVTPPSRPEHLFGFNAFELMGMYSPPTVTGLSVKDTTYTYNDDKQLTAVVRPDGQTAGYTYDLTTGLLNSLNLIRGDNLYQYQYRSEKVSRVDSADGIASEYTYYGDNVLSETQRRSSDDFLYAKLEYGFDTDHRQVSRTLRGNSSTPASTISTTFNEDDMPTQIGAMTLEYSYPSGRLSTTVLDKISDSRTYDAYGNLSSYTAIYTPTSGPVQTLYSYTLTRDVMSRISSKSETVLGVTNVYDYSFDTAGRLTTVLKNSLPYSSYTYDSNGNRTSGTHAGTAFAATFDDQDRMLTYNSRVYSYNANGDNTQIDWNTTETTHFSYDAIGNLMSATMPDATALSFKYDGVGRQVQVGLNGSTELRRIYEDDLRIAGHYGDAGLIAKEFVFGTGLNTPDYMISSGINYFLIKDHLGSPRLIVRGDDGSVAQRIDYTEFGKITSDSSPGFQPYAFAGGILESHTKLVKFGARYYDSDTGRWTSKDPVRFDGGDTNLYGYVLQDPVNYFDPQGKVAYWISGTVFLVGSIAIKTYVHFNKDPMKRLDEMYKENNGLDVNKCPIGNGRSTPPEFFPLPKKGYPASPVKGRS